MHLTVFTRIIKRDKKKTKTKKKKKKTKNQLFFIGKRYTNKISYVSYFD